jgi:hypothetical protein
MERNERLQTAEMWWEKDRSGSKITPKFLAWVEGWIEELEKLRRLD